MGRWEEKRRRVLSGWHPPRPRLRVLWAGGGGVGREGAWAGATVVPPRRPAPRPPPCVVMAPARFPMVCAHVCIRSSATAPPPFHPHPGGFVAVAARSGMNCGLRFRIRCSGAANDKRGHALISPPSQTSRKPTYARRPSALLPTHISLARQWDDDIFRPNRRFAIIDDRHHRSHSSSASTPLGRPRFQERHNVYLSGGRSLLRKS